MMICYKALSGVEMQHWKGYIYFWLPDGVFSLTAATLHRHGRYHGPREVQFHLFDRQNNVSGITTEKYPESFDDWEIINRYIRGTGSCDCQRGRMMYGKQGAIYDTEAHYSCNKGPNRFLITKMVIKGAKLNCIIRYRGYV